MKNGYLTFLMLALGCAAGCSNGTPTTETKDSSIEVLADEYLAALLDYSATMGTFLSIEGARHDRLPDISLEALAKWQSQEELWLQRLLSIDEPIDIGSRDWVSYGVLRETLESSIARRVCQDELWQASDNNGWHRWLPFLFSTQPVDTDEYRQQVLARLGQFDDYIDTQIANLRLGLEQGYSSPRVTVQPVPEQIRAMIGDDSIFLNPTTRIDDEEFAAAVRSIYDDEIVPALNRYADFLDNVYLTEAREEIGLDTSRRGDLCYAARVRSYVTIQPTAEDIHALGLEQVDKIRGEMRVTLDAHFGGGQIGDFLRRINTDPEFTFSSEEEVLNYSLDGLDAAKAAMTQAFGVLPKADVLVKPYPEFAASGTGEYWSSSEDGSRPGIYYIPVIDPTRRSRAVQLPLLYHETYPGHHHQGAIALELGDKIHPLARYLWNHGYSEGWGLYSERLADELGLYPTPLDRMGMYSDQLARAARLVIDTGLHSQGWTRQQAVDYLLGHSGWSEVDVESEINRYIADPGQATAYMLGMLEIRRLRTLAETELGDAFDLRAFHDRVVGYGQITLPMLEASILSWIAEQKATID